MLNYLNFADCLFMNNFIKKTMKEIGQKFYDSAKTKPKDLTGKQCTLFLKKLANQDAIDSTFCTFFVKLAEKFLKMKESCFGNTKKETWAEDLSNFEAHLKPRFDENRYPNSPLLHTIVHIRSVLEKQEYGLGFLSTELSESAHYRLGYSF